MGFRESPGREICRGAFVKAAVYHCIRLAADQCGLMGEALTREAVLAAKGMRPRLWRPGNDKWN